MYLPLRVVLYECFHFCCRLTSSDAEIYSTGCTNFVKILKQAGEGMRPAPGGASEPGATLKAMNQPPAPKIQLINTPEYRENYANSVQVRVNLWDFLLLFGRVNQTSPEDVMIHNFQAVYVSPQQAKALLNVLQAERHAIRDGVRRDQAGAADARRHRAVIRGTRANCAARPPQIRPGSYVLMYLLFAAFLIPTHLWLAQLPYFWDEAGQFVPAALDLLHGGVVDSPFDAAKYSPSGDPGVSGRRVADRRLPSRVHAHRRCWRWRRSACSRRFCWRSN